MGARELIATINYETPDPACAAPRKPAVFYVYLLRCHDGSVYIGHSTSLERRLAEHRAGEVVWTKSRLPVVLFHVDSFATRNEAVRREKQLKTGFGRKWIKRKFGSFIHGAAGRPDCDLDYVPNTSRPSTIDFALKNSFGFGGKNSALVIKKYEW